jgi:hypothetical protein
LEKVSESENAFKVQIENNFSKLPLSFEENKGQTNEKLSTPAGRTHFSVEMGAQTKNSKQI